MFYADAPQYAIISVTFIRLNDLTCFKRKNKHDTNGKTDKLLIY